MLKNKSIKVSLFTLLFLLSLSFFPLTARASRESDVKPIAEQPESQSELLLGTVCKITIYDYPEDETFEAAFARIDDIEQQMSITIADSSMSAVNANAGIAPTAVPTDTYTVVEEAVRIAELSEGAFDPSVGPLVQAWGIGTDFARVPDEEEIRQLLKLVDYRSITLNPDNRTVFPEMAGMVIDLGGIAKGFAADAVREVLLDHGVGSAIINLGGNVLTVGEKPGNRAFRIGIQDPDRDRGTYVIILSIRDTAIVTSGPYERFFTVDDTLYHHILDTDSGYPVDSDIGSISIIAHDSFAADALSTAYYSMGIEKGMAMIEQLEGVEAIAITKSRQVIMSSGISGSSMYEITDSSFSEITLEQYLETR